jgi:hypothetical protein
VEGVVLLLSYLIKMTKITLSSLSGKIVVLQPPPQEPQTSNIGPIAGGIGGVVRLLWRGLYYYYLTR